MLSPYLPGTHSTRGKFSDRSSSSSAEIFVSLHRGAVVLGVALALTAIGGGLVAKRKLS